MNTEVQNCALTTGNVEMNEMQDYKSEFEVNDLKREDENKKFPLKRKNTEKEKEKIIDYVEHQYQIC